MARNRSLTESTALRDPNLDGQKFFWLTWTVGREVNVQMELLRNIYFLNNKFWSWLSIQDENVSLKNFEKFYFFVMRLRACQWPVLDFQLKLKNVEKR